MKLDTINTMVGNINNSSKKETSKVSKEFIQFLEESSNEEFEMCNLLENDEEKELEELIMKLIEMMFKKSDELLDLENSKDNCENINNTLMDINKSNIKELLNIKENNVGEIFDTLSVEQYFQGNKVNTQEIVNILDLIKKENDTEEVNSLLDKLKNKITKNSNSSMKGDFAQVNFHKDLHLETNEEELIQVDSSNIDNSKSIDIKKYIKENNITVFNEKINSQDDKDINILKEIIKDDKGDFIINENKYRVNTDLNISSSRANNLTEIRTSNFTNDVFESINYLKNNNLQELKVNLNPKELGEITIKLIKSDKETKLSIVVAKDEVYSLVNKNLQEISKHLESLDIKVNEISVDINNDNQSSFSDNFNQHFREQKEKKKNNYQHEGESIEIDNDSLIDNENINLLA